MWRFGSFEQIGVVLMVNMVAIIVVVAIVLVCAVLDWWLGRHPLKSADAKAKKYEYKGF